MTQPAQTSSIHARRGWHKLTYTLSNHVPWSCTHAAKALHAARKSTGLR